MYTDLEILCALRNAYYNLAVSGAKQYTIYGRTYVREEIADLQEAIAWFERRVDGATQPGLGGGTLLVGLHGLD